MNIPESPVGIVSERISKLFDSRRARDFWKALYAAETIARDMLQEKRDAQRSMALNVIRTFRDWYGAYDKKEHPAGEAFETYIEPLPCAVADTFNNHMTPRALLVGLRKTMEILPGEITSRGGSVEDAQAVSDMLHALCKTLDTRRVWNIIDPSGLWREDFYNDIEGNALILI